MIERDSEGRLTFLDNQVSSAVTLADLVLHATFANLIRVAETGGDTDDPVEAYDMATSGGMVLIYPGVYELVEPLALGEKSCAFVGLDPGGTIIRIAQENYNIVIGNPADGTGEEDWDEEEHYTPTGRFVFDGITFESGQHSAIRIKRADMSSGGLTVRGCEFRGLKGIDTAEDDINGYSTGLNVSVRECVFRMSGEAGDEEGILLSNRSRGGESPGYLEISGCTFNPGTYSADEPAGSEGLYYRGVVVSGSLTSVEIGRNTFNNCQVPIMLFLSCEDISAGIRDNTILFHGDTSEETLEFVSGVFMGGSSGNQYTLENNRIRITDTNGSALVGAGYYMHFSADEENVLESRNNSFRVEGAAAADYDESDATEAYEIRVTDDIWNTSELSIGELIIDDGGDRRNREVRIEGNLGVGGDGFAAGVTHVIGIGAGTAPSTGEADMVQLFAEVTTGTLELRVTDGAGNTTTLSPHNFTLFDPPADAPLPFSYYSRNPYLGLEMNVDMIGAIMEIERLSGKKFIHIKELPAEEREEWHSGRGRGGKSRGPDGEGERREPPEWLKARLPHRRSPEFAE